jgi:ADP-heptose:LPS heptosyltransferase
MDIPCFGIYGPFPGEIRLKTYPKATWINAKRHCAPCFLHSPHPCPQAGSDGYSPCYNELIDTDEKLDILGSMIEEFFND